MVFFGPVPGCAITDIHVEQGRIDRDSLFQRLPRVRDLTELAECRSKPTRWQRIVRLQVDHISGCHDRSVVFEQDQDARHPGFSRRNRHLDLAEGLTYAALTVSRGGAHNRNRGREAEMSNVEQFEQVVTAVGAEAM